MKDFEKYSSTQRKAFGVCPLCERRTDLTFHHLIPKKMHRRNFFKKHYDKKTLNIGINICRDCHNGIHRTYSEMELAKQFNNVEAIIKDEKLSNHFQWLAKQKIKSH